MAGALAKILDRWLFCALMGFALGSSVIATLGSSRPSLAASNH